MNEMVGYIFGSLHNSEKAIKNIVKTLNKQYRFNKNVANFALVSAVCITIQHVRITLNERAIKALRNEIKELKSEKGE